MKLIYIFTSEPQDDLVRDLSRLGAPCRWGTTPPPEAKYVVFPITDPGTKLGGRPGAVEILNAAQSALAGGMDRVDTKTFKMKVRRAMQAATVPEPAPAPRPPPVAAPTPSMALRKVTVAQVSAPQPQAPAPAPAALPIVSEPWLKVVTVCRSGGEYTPQHVRWLRRQVAARIKTPHRFLCLSDTPNLVPGGVLLQHDWAGFWAKIELFRPGLFKPEDTILFLDLDTVVTRDFEVPRLWEPHLYMLPSFTRPEAEAWMSGVLMWRGDWSFIYQSFTQMRKAIEFYCMGFAGGDQAHIALSCLHRGKTIESVMKRLTVGWWDRANSKPTQNPEDCDVYCWYGSRRPWQFTLPWIPPLEQPARLPDLALVVCYHGEDEDRLRAAQESIRHLNRLLPRPARALLVEASYGHAPTRFPKWDGEFLPVVINRQDHEGLWYKEDLFQLGAEHILSTSDSITKFVFLDIDTRPAVGEEDWLAITSDALDRFPLLHPYTTAKESQGGDLWLSYSAQVALKLHGIKDGQGFAVAMTTEWFRACGGFPRGCVAGGGDAVAVLRWEKERKHSRVWYNTNAEARRLVDAYAGPKTDYGYQPGTLVHQYHGPRTGPLGNRRYLLRHRVWEWCGGWQQAVEYGDDGLARWKQTPLALAVRHTAARILEPKTEEQYKAIWEEELVNAQAVGAVFDAIYTEGRWNGPMSSGPGSTLEATDTLQVWLKAQAMDRGWKRVLDVGCGRNTWMTKALPKGVAYLGIDASRVVIEQDPDKIGETGPNWDFMVHDITEAPLPARFKYDVAICRDVMTHLSNALVIKALAHIRQSSRWLLATDWPGNTNTDIVTGQWRGLNLCAGPFNLKPPVVVFDEKTIGKAPDGKTLALFDLEATD